MLFSINATVSLSASASSDTTTVTGTFYYDYSNSVLKLVNKQRAANGVSALDADETLTKEAMLRAAELAVSFSHTRPNGSSADTAYTWTYTMGENIAWGQMSADEVMVSWMNSSGHKANILSSNYTKIGIGCFYCDGIMYWVQAFSAGSCEDYTPAGIKPVKVKVALSTAVETKAWLNKSGSCGSDVKYSFDTDTYTLTISGSGKMKNYSSYYGNGTLVSTAPWASYSSYIKKVVIKSGVTTIGSYAFLGCGNMTSIKIENTVTKICSGAFDSCSGLKTVTYSGSKSQWSKASSYCSSSALTSASVKCVGNCTLSKTVCTYTGNVKKPKVTVKDGKGNTISSKYYTVSYISCKTGKAVSSMKSVGKYYVQIKFKGKYSGTVKKVFTIKPKGTSISSVSAKSQGFTVKWNKVTTQTTGYQVQYSKSSSFSPKGTKTISDNSKKSLTITGLAANKTYYVRVRTYKTVKVNGKSVKLYSSWSNAKTVTTKA